MVTAYVFASLDAECPNCLEDVDVMQLETDMEVTCAIFSAGGEDWGSLNGMKFTCPKCFHEFEITDVEY